MKKILYPSAFDELGNLVMVLDAIKGGSFSCIECSDEMVLKRGAIKVPHFAHKFVPDSCTGEGVLHYTFKTLLYRLILSHLDTGQELPITWECDRCNKIHAGNLLKRIASVEIEKHLDKFIPDLSLFDSTGNPVAVIEVIVTHSIEPEARAFYKRKGIKVLEVHLKDIEDLNCLKALPLNFEIFQACTEPRFFHEGCGGEIGYKASSYLFIRSFKCLRCGVAVNSYAVDDGLTFNLEDITPSAITFREIIKNEGIVTRYHTVVCSSCSYRVGEISWGSTYDRQPKYSIFKCLKCDQYIFLENKAWKTLKKR